MLTISLMQFFLAWLMQLDFFFFNLEVFYGFKIPIKIKFFYLRLLAVWQTLLSGLELCRQKQGKCMRRAELQELDQAISVYARALQMEFAT